MATEAQRVGHTDLLDRYDTIVDHHSLVAEQYGNDIVLEAVRLAIPISLTRMTPITDVIEWFQTFVTWSKEPNLKRFNYVPKLLETRTGRCGEWAILFTAVLCALGHRARLVLDFEDHVWTEVWLRGKWVHSDSTLGPPNNYDHPYVYQDSFKHKIVKIVAFSPGGFTEDVTERYRRAKD